ncbi:hypothetical protein KSC_058140 [Ktedonobacter sp. SOSP1-52]|uniref:sialidase family protein n=1 Tax=Ktedonobacter sp. SOSP1-52 TaxID=2778366 RepID=UPI00191507AD|nr:sialidase family protein [Ktedonobacter sp. SOSP1-52]GHO66922.1 hypothetical protein KSC_058140 [Ktedonobacter sp. SOSP1-52]
MHFVSLPRKDHIPFLIVTTLMLIAGLSFAALRPIHALAASPVAQQISSDLFTNPTSQHQTQVEPSTFSYGSTVVAAFQSGRFATYGGASGISWATSFDAGLTWKRGTLSGLTVAADGSYARASNPVVVYDQAHHIWLLSVLAAKTQFQGSSGSTAVVVSRSSNGLTWSNPVLVAATGSSDYFDKDWIVCDNHPTSAYYGRCYEEWDNGNADGQILMSSSNDGGLTWSQPVSPASQSFSALGGQPVVQPSGNVIVPIYGYDLTTGADGIYSYRSTDGGATWTDLVKVSPSTYSGTAAPFYRGGSLPSAKIDASGKVYLVWAGCYFEANCLANETGDSTDDIVLTTSTDGITWTPLQRIPLDAIGSDVEHITAALAVDSNTAGSKAHLAVTYYYWANAGSCAAATCQIYVGLAMSTNGGTTWSQHQTLAGPTTATWWASTEYGYMTGDYISASIANNRAVSAFPVATAPTGTTLHQSMYSGSVFVTGGSIACETLTVTPKVAPAGGTSGKNYHMGS